MRIHILYEQNLGGETKTIDNIFDTFNNIPNCYIIRSTSKNLLNTDFFSYSFWIIGSIFYFIFQIIKNINSDWIYTSTYTGAIAALIIRPLFSYKICFHYHGNRIPHKAVRGKGYKYYPQFLKHLIVQKLHKIVFRKVDIILLPTQTTIKSISNFLISNQNPNIHIIPNGINLTIYSPGSVNQRKNVRKYFKLQGNEVVISYIGRLNPLKNIHILNAAFNKIHKDFLNTHLFIFFPHPYNKMELDYKQRIENQIVKLHLDERIHLIENYPHMREAYILSDFVILPSAFENFPLVLLEAWAMNCIFTGTGVGEMKRLLNRIDPNLIIKKLSIKNLENHLRNMLEIDQDNRIEIIKRQNSLIKNFDWKEISLKIYNIIASPQ